MGNSLTLHSETYDLTFIDLQNHIEQHVYHRDKKIWNKGKIDSQQMRHTKGVSKTISYILQELLSGHYVSLLSNMLWLFPMQLTTVVVQLVWQP